MIKTTTGIPVVEIFANDDDTWEVSAPEFDTITLDTQKEAEDEADSMAAELGCEVIFVF